MNLKTKLLILWIIFGSYISIVFSINGCSETGYTPKNGYRKPPVGDSSIIYYEGSKLRYYCNDGYIISTTTSIQICTLNNIDDEKVSWVPHEQPKCILKAQCSNIEVANGSSIKGPFWTGDIVTIDEVNCNEGFVVKSPGYIKCTENGTWSGEFKCLEKNCSDLSQPKHGKVFINDHSHFDKVQKKEKTWPPGSTAYYFCDNPYILINNRRRDCQLGEWSGTAAECVTTIPLSCLSPPSIKHGKYSPIQQTYKIGTNVTYTCNDNTQPHGGDITKTCLPNLTWSGVTPHCSNGPTTPPSIMYCPQPSPFNHGVILCCPQEANFPPYTCCSTSGKVQFACEPGYKLYHDTEWTCSSQGDWLKLDDTPVLNSSSPSCVLETTTNPTKVTNKNQLSSEMIKTVLGVSIGVLGLLTIVVILSFCRPKLREIKQRWRDFREDENGLLVNGQRVNLPSYDEAITSNDIYQQVCQPPVLNNFSNINTSLQDETITRPPESNLTSVQIDHEHQNHEIMNPDIPSTSNFDRFFTHFTPTNDNAGLISNQVEINTDRSDSPISVTEFLLSTENLESEISPEIEESLDIENYDDDVSLISLSMPTSSSNNDSAVAYKDERYLNQDNLVNNQQDAISNQEKFQVTNNINDSTSTLVEITEDIKHTDSTSL